MVVVAVVVVVAVAVVVVVVVAVGVAVVVAVVVEVEVAVGVAVAVAVGFAIGVADLVAPGMGKLVPASPSLRLPPVCRAGRDSACRMASLLTVGAALASLSCIVRLLPSGERSRTMHSNLEPASSSSPVLPHHRLLAFALLATCSSP
ncbi:MAG TPA: hypothetical protein VLU43_17505 [Anaeromyxobacteraceae bacterium]|nr:hypothetical protein [Anaeromyxobacteraceae bacterium]